MLTRTPNSSPLHVDETGARRSTNKVNAIALARIGVAVFPSSGKVPLIPRFNQLDTTISAEERQAAVDEFREKNDGKDPIHVGATKDPETVKRMWRAHRDAVPSIACGPSRLVVLDADQKDNGPELMDALFEQNGGVPTGAPVLPTKSGGKHFVFADPDGTYTNKAGLLKKSYGTDVRGTGGQFVAPGSIREDGKTYGTREDLAAFCRAITGKKIPTLPSFVTELIGSQPDAPAGELVTPSEEARIIAHLRDVDWPEFDDVFDGTLGKYDLSTILADNPELKAIWESEPSDCSTARFKLARGVMRECPDLQPEELAVLFENCPAAGAITDDKPGTGEYDHRQIAREWKKNTGLSKPSSGDSFGAVVDEEDEPEVDKPASTTERQAKRFIYIENIRGAVLRMMDWCIKFFVARGTTSVATGLWGAGKTAVFSDIGLHVGHGFEWRGRKVAKGVVIYVALENSEDVERRVATWCDIMERAGRDLRGGAFVVHRGPCRLFDPSGKPTRDEKDLIEIANTAAEHYGLNVSMIVIDTLAQSMMPGNDNDAKDAGIYTAAMQRIAAATGANVTALAHPTKSGEGVRGSGALQANVDTVIEVSRDASGRGTIKSGSKFRIGNPAKVKFGYRLKSHVVGRDDDGDDIDVVLAIEDQGLDLRVDDTDEDAAILTPPDTPADKLATTLRVFRERVESLANATGEAVDKIGLQAGEVFAGLNGYRRSAGLPELKDRTIVSRLLGRLVEGGEIVKSGDNRRTVYKLA
jgi:hypothetical protein